MKRTKIAIAIGLFAVAGLVTWLTRGTDDAAPPDDASTTAWRCADCDKRVELTIADYMAAMAKADNAVPLYCSACAEKQVYQVALCPVCSTEYFGREVPGHSGVCPICNPPEADIPPDEVIPDRQKNVARQL